MPRQQETDSLLSVETDATENIVNYDIERTSRFEGLVLQDVIPKRRKVWYKYQYLRELNFLLLSAILTQITVGYDMSMLNGLQSVPVWNAYFEFPTGTRLGAMANALIAGELAVLPILSHLCDKYGRRLPILWGCALIIVGSLLQSMSLTYHMFTTARFIIGLGLGITQTAAPLLIVECAYPSQRGQLTSIIEPAWPVGSFFAAIITYATFKMGDTNWSWRIPSLLQGFFPALQFLIGMYAPESPRWLISQDRHDEAFEFLVRYHSQGDRNSDLVHFEMAEISATIEAEKLSKQSRWHQFVETPGMRHRLFIVIFLGVLIQLGGNSVLSYYLPIVLTNMGIADSNTQLLINLGSTVFSIITAFSFGLQVDRIGRRLGFIVATSMMFVSYCIWTYLSALSEARDVQDPKLAFETVAVIYMFQMFYHLLAPFAPTYLVEIVPFSLRSKATMLNQISQNVILLFDNFINPLALEALKWRFYLIYCFVLAIEVALVYMFFPESGGKGLEEIAEIFDSAEGEIETHSAQQFGLDEYDSPNK